MRFNSTKLIASMALAALTSSAYSAIVYSLDDNGGALSLVRFDSAAPSLVTTVGTISGATPSLDGLDFRPADGFLYGYRASTAGIYQVDINNGATTLVSTSSPNPVTSFLLGIDFNPVVDRLRVVTPNDDNRRIDITTGGTITDGALTYAPGNPNILDAAYTNSDNNGATGTALFYIDSVLDVLATTSAPNAGTLSIVGSLGLDTNDSVFLGFDIFTDAAGINTAYASLQVAGVDGLYTINLGTGAATLVGLINADNLFGLAVAPAQVPEPGSLALLAAAGLAAFGLRRRDQDSALPTN